MNIYEAVLAILAASLVFSSVITAIYLEFRVQMFIETLPDLRGVANYSNGTLNITLELWKGIAVKVCYIEVGTDSGNAVLNVTGGSGHTIINGTNVTAVLEDFVNNNVLPSGATASIHITFNDTTIFSGKSYPVIIYDCEHRILRVLRFTAP